MIISEIDGIWGCQYKARIPMWVLKWGIQKTLVSILRWSNLADFRVPPFNLGILHMGIVITYIVITPNDPADILGQHCTSGIKKYDSNHLINGQAQKYDSNHLNNGQSHVGSSQLYGKIIQEVRCPLHLFACFPEETWLINLGIGTTLEHMFWPCRINKLGLSHLRLAI